MLQLHDVHEKAFKSGTDRNLGEKGGSIWQPCAGGEWALTFICIYLLMNVIYKYIYIESIYKGS